ncbi:hypothetical protein BGZ63DRAFT_393341 [Mariannaea sp. PMI_226]|nr:hypothetical protein BGZ63DRAFT_393341 [Mariannaea sp. PMI_226]
MGLLFVSFFRILVFPLTASSVLEKSIRQNGELRCSSARRKRGKLESNRVGKEQIGLVFGQLRSQPFLCRILGKIGRKEQSKCHHSQTETRPSSL